MEPILESEMLFGPYSDDEVFWIEKSRLYTRRLEPNGVKCCEFILNRGKNIYFVEAKETCPNKFAAESTEEKMAKYKEYIEDVTGKMRHSLATYASVLLNRHPNRVGLPANLTNQDLSKKTLKLLLVIKNAEIEWLDPLQTVLNRELKIESSIWCDVRLYAINEEMARKKGFVI